MDSKELTLEGHEYLGKFRIEQHSHLGKELVHAEIGQYYRRYNTIHYTGEGSIINKKTGLEQKLIVYPAGMDVSNLIILPESVQDRIKDYRGIVDISLHKMYEDAKTSKEIIPKVVPVSLDASVLIEKGLILQSEGALRN
jgi:hypothetical protein